MSASFSSLFYRLVSLTCFSKNFESSRRVSTFVFMRVVSFFYLISASLSRVASLLKKLILLSRARIRSSLADWFEFLA